MHERISVCLRVRASHVLVHVGVCKCMCEFVGVCTCICTVWMTGLWCVDVQVMVC